MKRVLLLAESPYMGGITSHILSILRAFRDHDEYRPLVATLPGRRGDETLIRAAEALGADVHLLPMAGPYDLRVRGALRRLLCKEGVALVHTHNYRATLVAEAAAGAVPCINTCHGAMVNPSWRLRTWQWAELQVMRRRPAIIACSDHVRGWLASQGVDPVRVHVVHNGFPLPEEHAEGSASRESLGIAADVLVLLYAGRLVEGKGIEHLIDALAGLPEAAGLILGDGPLRPALEARARECGANVRFTGAVEAPGAYYRMADVAVLPSRMEALPMMLIEAAAFGLPAIATRAGGIPEVVQDGQTGVLVEHGDVPSLREAIRRLADPTLRGAFGRAARQRWQETFSAERFAASLARVYDLCR